MLSDAPQSRDHLILDSLCRMMLNFSRVAVLLASLRRAAHTERHCLSPSLLRPWGNTSGEREGRRDGERKRESNGAVSDKYSLPAG